MSKSKGFLGPTYTLSTVSYEAQDEINLYPEMSELETGKEQEPDMNRSVPGLTLTHVLPRSPIRCIHQTLNGYVYVVAGNGVYNLTTTNGSIWQHTLVTTLTTTTGRVYMTDGIPNVVQGVINTGRINYVVIVDGSTTGIVFKEGTNTTTPLTSGNGYNGSNFVSFQDGFYLFSQPNTPVIQFAADPLNISYSDTIVVNLGADNIARAISDHDILWNFGTKSSSVWQNTGGVGYFGPTNLFQQIPGSYTQGGCFPHTVAQINGQLVWLQNDANGCAQVFEALGFRGSRISNHAIELYIQQCGDLTGASAWCYQSQGHSFYCLNIPGANATLCYDLNTKMWHKRAYTIYQSGILSRDLVEYHYNINLSGVGQISLCGDFSNGNLYILDGNNYTFNGQPIYRQRTTPHISSGLKRVFWDKVQVDVEGGTGLATPYQYNNGTTGGPVLTNTLSTPGNPLYGNGATAYGGPAQYQFTANDGSIVTPISPNVTAYSNGVLATAGTYSTNSNVTGNTLTVLQQNLTVPAAQFGLGDGTTDSFNL